MTRGKVFAGAGAILMLALAAAGIAVAAEARSGGLDEKGSGPHCVGRALTEEEAAAGVPGEVECFDTFEEALRSINVEPEDLKTSALPPADAGATRGVGEAVEASSGAGPRKHCAASPGQEPLVVSCFNTFSDAIYFATGGAVRLPCQ